METLSGPSSRCLKRFWRIRGYDRLDGKKKNMEVIKLGGKRKRFWAMRATPKLRWRLKIVSPMKLLAKLRDAYINMMLGWAGNVGSLNSDDSMFGGKRIPRARKIEMDSKAGDFESRLILEIYKSMKTSQNHEMVAR